MTFDAFTKHLLDQFRMAIPETYRPPSNYEISFLTRDQINDFLRSVGAHGVETAKLENAVARTSLPLEEAGLNPRTLEILQAFWRHMYEGQPACLLTFPMINRLVELMLKANPKVLRSLRSTYPIVFLDEFQDTTYPQFDLVRTAFVDSATVFTAVGDDKQKIMGWAGAMNGAFAEFTAATNARSISLLCNWRSHRDLVAIQHVIAQQIDPDVEMPEARQARLVDGQVAAIWEFDNRDEETSTLAAWIANEIAEGRVAPHDIAILARMRVDRIENELGPALSDAGVALRNLARNVGKIAIQDLLAEDLTVILMALLRLGVERRNAKAWHQAQEGLAYIEAVGTDDDLTQRRLADRVTLVAKEMRQTFRDVPFDPSEVRPLVEGLVEKIGGDKLRRVWPAYQRDADFRRVIDGFVILLEESVERAADWKDALDKFEGRNEVALMTIHKSKGLEFHTMIFFGLDSRSWRGLQPDEDEEMNAFFVAFSRAAQRAFFTFCHARGGRIGWLEELLGEAVPRVRLTVE